MCRLTSGYGVFRKCTAGECVNVFGYAMHTCATGEWYYRWGANSFAYVQEFTAFTRRYLTYVHYKFIFNLFCGVRWQMPLCLPMPRQDIWTRSVYVIHLTHNATPLLDTFMRTQNMHRRCRPDMWRWHGARSQTMKEKQKTKYKRKPNAQMLRGHNAFANPPM